MENIQLPYFQNIDTNIGLKYLNNNKKLYLKILNNFLHRYRDLKIDRLKDNETKDMIHGIKGLSSTLGMINLNKVATTIHNNKNIDKLKDFSKELSIVINELILVFEKSKNRTILLMSDKIIDIDILVEVFDDKYDVVVALDNNSALDTLKEESISIVLLDTTIDNIDIFEIYSYIKKMKIPIILLIEDSNKVNINKIFDINSIEYILKPINIKKLEDKIDRYLN